MIVPLNIVTTYPVRWSKYKVFRDFVQNFYDSVGYADWKKRFSYEYADGLLRMYVEGSCFSYEWLLHIGASTKTKNANDNAGYFGEGFKIASLCAMRDFEWTIKMSSGNWKLSVICVEQSIDSCKVQMLAYEIEEQEEDKRSCLELSIINEKDFLLFQDVLSAFYYPENLLIGEKIWEGERGAVYTRSKNEYRENLPFTSNFGKKGAVFCSYQLLGSNPFDLVVCLHHYRKEDRERNSIYPFEVINVMEKVAACVDAYGAMQILEKMRRYWNSTPRKRIDIYSWTPVINKLIVRMSETDEVVEKFKKKYPDLLYLKPLFSIRDKNERNQAKVWLRGQDKKYLLVQERFQKLGYRSLEDVCEENGGFIADDEATIRENKGFEILETIVKRIYGDFFEMDEFPYRKVISNDDAAYHGMAKTYRKKKVSNNNKGLIFRYKVGEIYLKKNIFTKKGYFDALATYVHELCHAFGGDSSNAFSLGLTWAMEILLSNTEILDEYKTLWETAFDNDSLLLVEDT